MRIRCRYFSPQKSGVPAENACSGRGEWGERGGAGRADPRKLACSCTGGWDAEGDSGDGASGFCKVWYRDLNM